MRALFRTKNICPKNFLISLYERDNKSVAHVMPMNSSLLADKLCPFFKKFEFQLLFIRGK